MGKVGIVSLYGLYNYGNRLQGYAVDSLIRSFGYQSVTLAIEENFKYYLTKEWAHVRSMKNLEYRLKYSRFKKFVNHQEIVKVFSKNALNRLSKKFDYFVVGSDQIWHPYCDLVSGAKFLQFAKRDQRVALAPSFGVDDIPSDLRDFYVQGLNGFDAVSVRENAAIKLVEQLCGTTPVLLPDPTIAIERAEWLRVVDLSNIELPGNYLLTYFLGGCTPEQKELIRSYAAESELEIVDSLAGAYGPQDFLALIEGASFVLTDSFHACVFSLIFETSFLVFRRDEKVSTFSRIETLLQEMNANEAIFDKAIASPNLNWEQIRYGLAGARVRTLNYLSKSFQGN